MNQKKVVYHLTIMFILFLSFPVLSQWNYYVNDHLGNTRVVLDEDGDVKEFYDYYPFGMTMRDNVTGSEKARYTFTGKEEDLEQGLGWHYFGARYYDAEIGRWLGVDPLAEKYLNLSPYNYSLNNPLRYKDPDGETPWDILDWFAFGYSAYEFYKKPSWANAGWALADLGGAILPIVPTTGSFRHGPKLLSKVDIMKLNSKAGTKAEEFVEQGLKESGESYEKQVTRGNARLDFVTSSGKVIEVKNIDWDAKTYQKSRGVTGRINKIRDQLLKYKDILKEGEYLILKITKPQNADIIDRLQEMAQRVGAKIEWLE